MPRNRPLTPREHLALGAELSDIDRRLRDAWFALDTAYGRNAGERAKRVRDSLTKLRSWLDSQVCGELPPDVYDIEGVPIIKAYYGWRKGPQDRDAPLANWTADQSRQLLADAAEHVFDAGNPWLVPHARLWDLSFRHASNGTQEEPPA